MAHEWGSTQGEGIDVFVTLRGEAGSADGEKNEVCWAGVGDALGATGRNEKDIAGGHVMGREGADFGAAAAFEDEVTLGDGGEAVKTGGHTGFDTGACDGTIGIAGTIGQFQDVALLGGMEFRARVCLENGGVHALAYPRRTDQNRALIEGVGQAKVPG